MRRRGWLTLTIPLPVGHHPASMLCPKCAAENPLDATRCSSCGDSLSVAVLEVIRGELPEKVRFLRPRPYSVGRARHNDIALNEPSISKLHARIDCQGGRFNLVVNAVHAMGEKGGRAHGRRAAQRPRGLRHRRGPGHDLPDNAAACPAVTPFAARGLPRSSRRRRYSETVSWPRSTSAAFPDSRQQ